MGGEEEAAEDFAFTSSYFCFVQSLVGFLLSVHAALGFV
jgi:hypothetical protein